MGVEIERKFLVDPVLWEQEKRAKSFYIKQGYLVKSKEKTVRVRSTDEAGYITIKGATKNISRVEYEYEIPKEEAESLITTFCDKYIEKRRFIIDYKDHIWEVDEFQHPKPGLILAEIELKDENEAFEKPNWILEEVSHDPQYFNANML